MKTYNDFFDIVINNRTLIDVRAPIEYLKGSFINATNLPLINDQERHKIGICYKKEGHEEAIELGHHLVSGDLKEQRIKDWIDYLMGHPDSLLYCFRGGSRSKISQEWIFEYSGIEVPRLEGGYKAFRNYLIQSLDPINIKSLPIILGGYTGSGKTKLIEKLDHAIDLEGISNHRGSSFGKYPTEQPTQINFENNLAYALIHHQYKEYSNIVLEDEGKNIGRCYLPKTLVEYFNTGGLVLLQASLDERIKNTIEEYIIQGQNLYKEIFGESGIEIWLKSIYQSMDNIRKRLGWEKYNNVTNAFTNAWEYQKTSSSFELYNEWARILLVEYYDPMYSYQIKNTTKEIIFQGNSAEVFEYLKELR